MEEEIEECVGGGGGEEGEVGREKVEEGMGGMRKVVKR